MPAHKLAARRKPLLTATERFRRWAGFGVALTTSGPLALWSVDLQPPWPSGATALMSTATAVCGAAGIAAWNLRLKPGSGRKASTVALLAGALTCLAYMAVYSSFVREMQQQIRGHPLERRWVIGSELQESYRHLQATDEELLAMGDFHPENVWTPSSLMETRIALLGTFCLAFSLLTAGLAFLGRSTPPD